MPNSSGKERGFAEGAVAARPRGIHGSFAASGSGDRGSTARSAATGRARPRRRPGRRHDGRPGRVCGQKPSAGARRVGVPCRARAPAADQRHRAPEFAAAPRPAVERAARLRGTDRPIDPQPGPHGDRPDGCLAARERPPAGDAHAGRSRPAAHRDRPADAPRRAPHTDASSRRRAPVRQRRRAAPGAGDRQPPVERDQIRDTRHGRRGGSAGGGRTGAHPGQQRRRPDSPGRAPVHLQSVRPHAGRRRERRDRPRARAVYRQRTGLGPSRTDLGGERLRRHDLSRHAPARRPAGPPAAAVRRIVPAAPRRRPS